MKRTETHTAALGGDAREAPRSPAKPAAAECVRSAPGRERRSRRSASGKRGAHGSVCDPRPEPRWHRARGAQVASEPGIPLPVQNAQPKGTRPRAARSKAATRDPGSSVTHRGCVPCAMSPARASPPQIWCEARSEPPGWGPLGPSPDTAAAPAS